MEASALNASGREIVMLSYTTVVFDRVELQGNPVAQKVAKNRSFSEKVTLEDIFGSFRGFMSEPVLLFSSGDSPLCVIRWMYVMSKPSNYIRRLKLRE